MIPVGNQDVVLVSRVHVDVPNVGKGSSERGSGFAGNFWINTCWERRCSQRLSVELSFDRAGHKCGLICRNVRNLTCSFYLFILV